MDRLTGIARVDQQADHIYDLGIGFTSSKPLSEVSIVSGDESSNEEETKEKASIPDFGTPYDKARKGYSLASALLLAWAIIGIDLEEFFKGYHVTLKSPQAVPYVLFVLVAYFAFRLTVEWYQAEASRRQRLASRTDFFVAHALGVTALGYFWLQVVLQVQFANMLTSSGIHNILTGFTLALGVSGFVVFPNGRLLMVVLLLAGMIAYGVALYSGNADVSALPLVSGAALGGGYTLAIRWFVYRLVSKRARAVPAAGAGGDEPSP